MFLANPVLKYDTKMYFTTAQLDTFKQTQKM